MKKFMFLSLLTCALVNGAMADSTDPTAKNDSTFESQTSITLPPILQNGILKVEARTDVSKEFGTTYPLYVNWETSIYDSDCMMYWESVCHAVPIEVKIKALGPEFSVFSPEYIRAGVVRLLWSELGITAQIGSYLHNELHNGSEKMIVFNGFELGEVTFATDLVPEGWERVAFTIKGNANLAMGDVNSDILRGRFSNGGGTFSYLSSKGSLGVSFSQKFQIEMFGSVENYNNYEESLVRKEAGLGLGYVTRAEKNKERPVKLQMKLEWAHGSYVSYIDDYTDVPSDYNSYRFKLQLHY